MEEATLQQVEQPCLGEVPTPRLLVHAVQLAEECAADALLVCVDSLPASQWQLSDTDLAVIYLVNGNSVGDVATPANVVRIPRAPLTRMGRIKMGLLLALSRGLVAATDTIVCVSGAANSGTLDTVVVTEVEKEMEILLAPIWQQAMLSTILPEVLERVLDIATQLATEGREGKPVGAIFVIGDTENVLTYTRQLVLNPFHGHHPQHRNVLDANLLETVKEFSAIDGAFLIRGEGVIESVGTYLKTPVDSCEEIPPGLGARHVAAASITSVTDAIAITISESTGTVTVFRKGRIVTEIRLPAPRYDAATVSRFQMKTR